MRRLIGADLKRILAKPGIYIVMVLMIIWIFLRDAGDTASEEMEYYKLFLNEICLTFVLVPIYLAVYADELKSGIMISVIGMGMPRKKIVKAKLQDALYLLLGTYIILFIAALIKNSMTDLAITPRQNMFLFVFCIFCVIRGIGIIALSSLILFLTMSSAAGMLVLVIAGAGAAGALTAIQNYTKFPIYDISFMGLLDGAYADFQAGKIGLALIPALFYLFIVIVINIKIFEKKEMNL
ncbi:MAG: hypothetical protein K6E91_10480 [Butyrivibrio sp.]|nr:hypothetical protein [Butyrivibrio sp.]